MNLALLEAIHPGETETRYQVLVRSKNLLQDLIGQFESKAVIAPIEPRDCEAMALRISVGTKSTHLYQEMINREEAECVRIILASLETQA